MKRSKAILIRFTPEEGAAIDALSAKTLLNRSEIIRRLIRFGLQEVERRKTISFLFETFDPTQPLHQGPAGVSLNDAASLESDAEMRRLVSLKSGAAGR